MENNYEGFIIKSISLIMHGIKRCSGSCLYCSAASTMNYNEDGNKNTFKFDKEKTRKKILEFTEVENNIKNNESVILKIDLWGGNPLENFNEFKQVVDFCENELKEFKEVKLHTSGNGLELRDDEKVQYLIDHDIHYQLSHDGCGQFLRTGIIDPLYWEETKDNIVKLARFGKLDWINTTLNGRNFSFFENIEYWNKWRKENDLMECTKNILIKLNHIYEGTPPIKKKWLFDDYQTDYKCVIAPKKGEEIGDLNLSGKALNTYMHELRMLGLLSMMPNIRDNYELSPFMNYISGQIADFTLCEDESKSGICRQFQMGLVEKTFAIDTLGEYCQCNLIDSSSTVKNPSGKRLLECEKCEYKNFIPCKPCGSEIMTICNYCKEYARVAQEFEQIRMLIEAHKNINNFCKCENNQDPIYCVKNYK